MRLERKGREKDSTRLLAFITAQGRVTGIATRDKVLQSNARNKPYRQPIGNKM